MAKKKPNSGVINYRRTSDGKEICFRPQDAQAKRKGIRNINALPNYTKRRQVTGAEEE